MDIGDRIEIPVYISPSGKARPWSRTTAPAPGTPKEQGEVVSITPPQVAMDNGILGPFEPSYATVIVHPASVPVGTPRGFVVTAQGPAGSYKTKAATPLSAKVSPIYEPVANPTSGGVCCQRCRELNPYVDPGPKPYTCYACREDPYRFAS